ncbi:MAG: hypothetical protein A3K67_05105 [Euryarchaeota archaeon RBG_16_62_10]|nr:MAG: hypothetical protein A3K67_05105 [Euryarchaeota archaeon RBG_16_62_10]
MRTKSLGTVLIVTAIVLAIAGILFQKIPFVLASCAFSFMLVYARLRLISEIASAKVEYERTPGGGIAFASEPLPISLKVVNYSPVAMRGTIEDLLPPSCHVGAGTNKFDGVIPGRSGISLMYTVVPEKRGTYIFEGVRLESEGIFGLLSHEREEPIRTTISVHTAKEALRAARRLAGKEHFEFYGVSRTPSIIMHDLEFDSIREYIPGDKARDIHWKLLSKLERLMTKVYTKEGAIQTRIVLDCSRSMRQTAGRIGKLDHGVDLSLQLSKVLLSGFHAVGASLVDEVSVLADVAPSLSRSQFDKIVLDLKQAPSTVRVSAEESVARTEASEPGANQNPKQVGLTAEAEALTDAVRALGSHTPTVARGVGIEGVVKATMGRARRQKMLFIVISDLVSSKDAVLTAASICRRSGNRMIVLETYDDWYREKDHQIDVEDAEKLYETLVKSVRIEATLRGLGVGYLRIGPADTTGGIVRLLRRQSA